MKRTFTFLLLFVTLFVVACSGSGDSLESRAKTGNEEGLRAAGEIVANAILNTDSTTVYTYLSSECRSEIAIADLSNGMRSAVRNARTFARINLSEINIVGVETASFHRDVSGNVRIGLDANGETKDALENFISGQPKLGEVEDGSVRTDWFGFVYEDNMWKLNDCFRVMSVNSLFGGYGS